MKKLHKSVPGFIKIIAIAPAFFSPLCGCEKDIDLDGYRNPETERMLVVNSIINPDSLIAVSVTHPYFFSDPHLAFHPVPGLEVHIGGDGDSPEILDYDTRRGLYMARHKPQAGERLSLSVTGEGMTLFSTDTVPRKVEIADVTATAEGPMHIYWNRDYRFTYKITFQDTPGVDNYYFLSVEDEWVPESFSQMGQVDYTSDYVFQVLANAINQGIQGWQPDGVFGYPFSDKGIDGELYTLTVTEVLQSPLTWMIETLPRKINLYSISRPYFEYMVSVLAMDYDQSALKGNLMQWGLLEPMAVYSNIKGGAGLMGSYNLCRARVDLLQLAGGWPGS